jgi:general secretion pathway protein A
LYLSYFGLEREPFHITPDPDFLFPSPCHKEAFAAVLYGVQQQKGFVVVTGEVGTGKTTLLRAYIQKLKGSDIQPIYVFDPHLSFEELLEAIMHECGNDTPGLSQFARLQWLRHYLIGCYENEKSVVLIVDEAQNMPVETLENLRVLTNLETTKDKLMQVLLVGQPELEEKLSLHGLRQLNQRVAVRATLRQLTKQESADYIRHRIIQAGGSPDDVFTSPAVNAIVAHAKGNPRVLNITCDNVLISAFGARQAPVKAPLVKEVLRDIAPKRSAADWKRYVPVAAAAGIAATVILAGSAAVMMFSQGPQPAPVEASVAAPAKDTEPPVPVAAPEAVAKVDARQITLDKMNERAEAAAPVSPAAVEPEVVSEPEDMPASEAAPEEAPVDVASLASPATAESGTASTEPVVAAAPVVTAAVDAAPEAVTEPVVAMPAPEAALPVSEPVASPAPAVEPAAEPAPDSGVTSTTAKRKVERGDQLIRLVRDAYGYYDEALIAKVLAANPRLQDPNLIWAGEELVFPDAKSVTSAEAAQ